MLSSMIRVAAATALFGVLHSALASRAAKRAAEQAFGETNRNGLYRVFFIGQSLVSFGALAVYIGRQPNRELYHVRGPAALLMHGGQVLAIGYATAAANQLGIRRVTGWENLDHWMHGRPVPPEPEAQGPALDEEGAQRAAGPFATSRHPLNLAPLPIFWLWPRMTTSLLAFNLATTAYLVVGSLHEESRLIAAYGDRYRAYQHSGVPYFLPCRSRSVSEPLLEAGESSPTDPFSSRHPPSTSSRGRLTS